MKKLLKRILLEWVIIIGVTAIMHYIFSIIKGRDFSSSFFSIDPLSSIVIMCVVFTIGDIIKYYRGKI